MWREEPLINLARYINGFAFKPEHWQEDGLKIVRIEQLNKPDGEYDYCKIKVPSKNLIDSGDLIFSWSATLKAAIWKHGPSALNQHLFKVVPYDGVDKYFLFQILDFYMDDLGGGSHGSTMKHIKRGELEKFSVRIPDKRVQCEIAEVLKTADGAIEQTEALIAKYEQIKQGMMKDLFTRGVDENGQLRPSHSEAPHLYKKNQLGRVPQTWNIEPLSFYVPRAEYGTSISLSDDERSVPVLRMNNIANGEFDVSDLKYAALTEVSMLLLKADDVLFNRTNSSEHVGKTALWRDQLPEASFASYIVRLVPDLERILPAFLNFWLQQDEIQTDIRRFATPGVHQVNINPTNLRKTICAAPNDLGEQKAIVVKIDAIDRYISTETQALLKLKAEKSGLMQDLLTGKIPVALDKVECAEAVA